MNTPSLRNTLQPQLLSLGKEDALWAINLLQTIVAQQQTDEHFPSMEIESERTDISQAITAAELRDRLRPRIKELFK